MNQNQTLNVGDYFTINTVHTGGYYKVLAKRGNIYYVWCNLKLNPECHGMFGECPFKEDDPEVEKKCNEEPPETKLIVPGQPNYGGCHHTCMMINPDDVIKVPALKGLMDNPFSASE